MTTELYHCTDLKGLYGIISSQAFQPSYCLEKAEYLKDAMDFAFAMVSFADLLPVEVKDHMTKFKSVAYFKMSKHWAINNGISPIIYYNKSSPLSACFRIIIKKAQEEQSKKPTPFFNAVNIMLAFLKQYEGRYWIDYKNEWSDVTTFFTEREWRYIPLVEKGEAYYLEPEQYKDGQYRVEKRQELINHNYVLHFSVDDVLEIGISKEDIFNDLVGFYKTKSYSEKWLAKTKLLNF